MKGMQWVVGAVALVAFDVALIYGVRQWQARDVSALEVLGSAATAEFAPLAQDSPAVFPSQTACMDGVTWFYRADRERWVKLEPVLRCDVGDVRAGRSAPRGCDCRVPEAQVSQHR